MRKTMAVASILLFIVPALSVSAGRARQDPFQSASNVKEETSEAAACILFSRVSTAAKYNCFLTVANEREACVIRMVFCEDDGTTHNVWAEMKDNDQLTYLLSKLYPGVDAEGFLYIYVVDKLGSPLEVEDNALIASIDYAYCGSICVLRLAAKPYAYKALHITNPDGVIDLDGVEFERGFSQVDFSKFLGDDGTYTNGGRGRDKNFDTRIALLNTTGGKGYWHNVTFVVSNNEGKIWEITGDFPLYTEFSLGEFNEMFRRRWLLDHGNNPLEPYGAEYLQMGKLSVKANYAYIPGGPVIENSTLAAVLIHEKITNGGADASQNMESGWVRTQSDHAGSLFNDIDYKGMLARDPHLDNVYRYGK